MVNMRRLKLMFLQAEDGIRDVAVNGVQTCALPIYFLALFGVLKIRRHVVRPGQPGVPTEASQVFGRPFSVALLVTLIGTGEYMASAPIGIAFVLYLLLLIPVLRILAPLTEPRIRTLLYVLSVFYALEGLHLLVHLSPFFGRALFALIVLTALVILGRLARPSRLRSMTMQGRNHRIFVIGIRACLALLAVSLGANIIGFVSLAQVLGLIALVGPLVAAALYSGVRVLALFLSAVLHTPWAQALLGLRADSIERLGTRVLSLGARSEEHTSELQSRLHLVCRLLLEKKNAHPPPTRSPCATTGY